MNLKDNIYTYRKMSGLTQEDLAKRIGVSKQTVQKYESGEIANVPLDKVNAIANVLNVSQIDLLGLQDIVETDKRISRLIRQISALSDGEITSLETIVESMSNTHNKRP